MKKRIIYSNNKTLSNIGVKKIFIIYYYFLSYFADLDRIMFNN